MLRGIIWVAGVYFYFLIFAQFSFLEILAGRDFSSSALKIVMGAMALGGIVGSFAVIPLLKSFRWPSLMRAAAAFCAMMPLLAVAGDAGSLGVSAFAAISLGIGLGLGMLTVLLAANLPKLMSHVYLGAGIGTGLAYMLSNLPGIFQASPATQCYLTAAAVFLLALFSVKECVAGKSAGKARNFRLFPAGVICFTMLVWLDSAAFYIIQHTRELKLDTWGEPYLWRNAIVHLLVAALSGWLLLKGRIIGVLVSAFVLLGVAGLMASEEGLSAMAGYLYPAGVSLYSVALILYPAVWLGQKGATLRAAILFAVAGWIGSAMGIGMAQDLNAVPRVFVLIAGVVMLAPLFWTVIKKRKLEVIVCGVVAVLCLAWSQTQKKPTQSDALDQVSLGREVYISEGCIHCHSHYVRPETRDVLLWGPERPIEEVTDGKPVIIGNRRQGPDLLQVGLRRSKGWMKQHFIDPHSLVPNSSMPNYAYLFDDERGDALLAYLSAYQPEDLGKRMQTVYQWTPSERTRARPSDHGAKLFAEHCISCHGGQGRGDGPLANLWAKPPVNLVDGPFAFTSGETKDVMIARVIKFGIYGTDMPGHEILSDSDVKTLVEYVSALRSRYPK